MWTHEFSVHGIEVLRIHPRIGVFALLAWMGCAPALFGQNFVWDGGASGTGFSWAAAANWYNDTTSTNDVLPTTIPGSNIAFSNVNGTGLIGFPSSTTVSTMTVSSSPTYGLITFNNSNSKLPSVLAVYANGSGNTTSRTITINSGITLNSSTGVTFTGPSANAGTLAITLGTSNVNFSASPSGTLTIESVISGGGRISILGGGTVALNGANLFTGGVTVSGGSTLFLGQASGLGVPAIKDTALTIDNGYVRVSPTSPVNNITIPSTSGITITPNGAILGANAGKSLQINGPILQSGGPSRLTVGNASFGSGQVILATSSNFDGGFSDGVTVQNGATLTIAASSCLGLLPSNDDPDNVLLNNGTLQVSSGSVVLAAVRGVTITPLGATLLSQAALTVSSPILESGGLSRLTVTGGGLVSLGGLSNVAGGFSGGIIVTTAGTVFSISTTTALGVVPSSFVPNHFVLNSGTTFDYTNSGGVIASTRGWQIGPNTASGSATISLSRSTAGSTLRIDGAITNQPGGTGGLNVSGQGNILTLTAANTYGGGTTINSGTLVVNSPAQTGVSGTGVGNVNVNSGGTLAGTGYIIPSNPNSVNVAAGGTLAPGSAGSGTLSIFGPTNFSPNATLKIAITGSNPTPNGTPGSSSLGTAPAFSTNTFLNVAGTLTLDRNMKLMIDGTNGTFNHGQSYSFTVAQATNITGITPGYDNRITFDPAFSTTGFAGTPSDLALFVGNGTFGDANTAYVSFTVAPEPGTLLLFGAAGLAVVRTLRRRK